MLSRACPVASLDLFIFWCRYYILSVQKLHWIFIPYLQHPSLHSSQRQWLLEDLWVYQQVYVCISWPHCPGYHPQPLSEVAKVRVPKALDTPWSTGATLSLTTRKAQVILSMCHSSAWCPLYHCPPYPTDVPTMVTDKPMSQESPQAQANQDSWSP